MHSSSCSKNKRVLQLYKMFLNGQLIKKQEIADLFNVNVKSVQRDIDAIREFLSEQCSQDGLVQSIEYDRTNNGYRLVTQEISYLSKGEMLAVCKILIESRAFAKEKLSSILSRLLTLGFSSKDKEQIETYISNEIYNYMEPAHRLLNTEFLWQVSQAIKEQKKIKLIYDKLKGEEVSRVIKPVGVLFSEYYFYLMGVIDDNKKRKEFDKADDSFPTIYRFDRIVSLETTEEHFYIPYSERFKEGEYKNKIQYMYAGEVQHIQFKYTGPSIEAVLDKLPTAKIKDNKNGEYTVSAEVFGTGILMWLLSQGSKVEVVSPPALRASWLNEIKTILSRNEDKI